MVRETHHRPGVGGVEILRVGAGRIERDAEGLIQAVVGENFVHVRLAGPLAVVQHADHARIALGHENVAVGSGEQFARVLESLGKDFDLEALRHPRSGIVGPPDDVRSVVGGGRGKRGGQIGDDDPVMDAGSVGPPVAAFLFPGILRQKGRRETQQRERKKRRQVKTKRGHDSRIRRWDGPCVPPNLPARAAGGIHLASCELFRPTRPPDDAPRNRGCGFLRPS